MNLVPHPSIPLRAALQIKACARRDCDGTLAVAFRLEGDLAGVRIPAARPARIVDGLWQHTCFEAFVATAGTEAYHELNFAPSGEWAVYAFRAYRERVPLADVVRAPEISVECSARQVTLEAALPLVGLFAGYRRAPLRLGLTAVLEDETGMLSYWSLRHPPGPPDFHHPDVRASSLEAWDGACEGERS